VFAQGLLLFERGANGGRIQCVERSWRGRSAVRRQALKALALTGEACAAQVREATADSRTGFQLQTRKEIDMTTNQPIDLGKASEETKHMGTGLGDSFLVPDSIPGT
jgi:hypothetical protein